jgi:hypothetical protein
MSKHCPLYGVAIYMDCLECEEKPCKNPVKMEGGKVMKKIVIGIDQSYKNTGISIAVDGQLKTISNLRLDGFPNNSERRKRLTEKLNKVFAKYSERADKHGCELIIIIERIRLVSQGFLNIDYIKSIGALNSIIIDCAYNYSIPVYSVDTRAWKSQIIGTSKPLENPYGIDPNKWPTILWLKKQGYEKEILRKASSRKKKGVIKINGENYVYDDDAADSAGIALYGFIPLNKQKLIEEK